MSNGLIDYRWILAEAERHGWVNPRKAAALPAAEVAALFAAHAAGPAPPPPDGEGDAPRDDTDVVDRRPAHRAQRAPAPAPAANDPATGPAYTLERVDLIELDLNTNYLIKGVLPAAGIGVIYGPPNSGKTWAALDMAFAVAQGAPWQGHRTRQGTTCLIAAENAHNIRQRARMRCATQSLTDIPLYVLAGGHRMINITDPIALEQLIAQIADIRPAFLIVDTLATAMVGDENTPDAMGGAVRGLKRLQHAMDELGTFVLAVHHSGKDEAKGARGHSSLLGAVDVELKVTGDRYQVTLQGTKARTSALMAPIYLALDVVEFGKDDEGDPITYVQLRPLPAPADRTDGDPNDPNATAATFAADRNPQGAYPQTVYRVFQAHAGPVPNAPAVPEGQRAMRLADLVDRAAPALLSVGASARNSQEARQREKAKRAIEALANQGLLQLSGDWVVAT